MGVLNEGDWKAIANDFYTLWQFPHCVGAVDGKHIEVQCPPQSGSQFYNYKNYYSIVLLAVVDAKKKFSIIDVGSMGRFSDGGFFSNSSFGKKNM